jgi:hypothetical protein
MEQSFSSCFAELSVEPCRALDIRIEGFLQVDTTTTVTLLEVDLLRPSEPTEVSVHLVYLGGLRKPYNR